MATGSIRTRPAQPGQDRRRGARGHVRLVATALVAAAGLQIVVTTSAGAVPPPPPHPNDSQVRQAQRQASSKAAQVGQITSQLSSAQSALQDLQDDVELKQEDANKALVDLQTAQDAAAQAQSEAKAAGISSVAAQQAIDRMREKVDQFAAGSYEQGSALGSVAAYFGAKSPKDLLTRQELLNDISGSELNVLEQMREAQVQKANADSAARAAVEVARQKQAAATAAKGRADAAMSAAEAAAQSEAAQANTLQAAQADLQRQLSTAQSTVAGLKAQQTQYRKWVQEKQAEEAAAAARAVSLAAGGSVATVLRRAMSAIGVIYAWGGGNTQGPTRGIHDGGVADEFGDFDKVGFDCSGLMVYAFAGAGVYLPHFSGYQYDAGRHVPLSEIQPGDMLFYSSNGRSSGIHHVTLYIGGGQMVEAYESGMPVRVTSVRYYNGIMPYATRVL